MLNIFVIAIFVTIVLIPLATAVALIFVFLKLFVRAIIGPAEKHRRESSSKDHPSRSH